MKPKLSFPLRLRILATLLLLVTTVVSLITFVMANLFHDDKKTYINDLTSIVALSTAEECRSLLNGYSEKLRIFGQIVHGTSLPRQRRDALLEEFFKDFRDLVGIIVYDRGTEIASVLDSNVLDQADLTSEDVRRSLEESPPPFDRLTADDFLVENSTLSPKLRTLNLVVPSAQDGSPGQVILGIIRLDGLQRLAMRSGVFRVFLVDSHGILLAEPSVDMSQTRKLFRLPAGLDAGGGYSAGMTLEYDRDGTRMMGGYASTDTGGVIAAVEIPVAAAYIASREILNRLLLLALCLLILAALTGQLGSLRITRPIEKLVAATQQVGKGRFDISVPVQSGDEIGKLSNSFNQMARELKTRDQALNEAQAQLIQSEKLAAFGQLGAGVAHEVKNPLAGILGCAQLCLRKVGESSPMHRNLALIEKETKRCKTIVENLLRFARQEKALLEPIEVNPVIEDAMSIVNHQLELNNVKLSADLEPDLPKIKGTANQLQQVLLNLIMNAQQAMDGAAGNVLVTTRATQDGGIEIRVQDDGPGIPNEIKDKILEPFFTTKPGGKGTGLGLSVSYGIITDHGGTISIRDSPGGGATFILLFPPLEKAPVQDSSTSPSAARPEVKRRTSSSAQEVHG
jgi:signal transduction histidine kinase